MDKRKIYILIGTYNRVGSLQVILNSLTCQEGFEAIEAILVIENGGNFGVEDLLREMKNPKLKYFYLAEGNKSKAFNKVIRDELQPEDFLIFTDDDVKFSTGFITGYLDAVNQFQYGSKYYFGGGLIPEYENPPQKWMVPSLPPSGKGLNKEPFVKGSKTDFCGANWGIYANDVALGGYYNPKFHPKSILGGGEETYIQNKLFKEGYKPYYIESSYIYHWIPESNLKPFWVLKRWYNNGISATMIKREISNGVSIFLFSFIEFFYQFFMMIIEPLIKPWKFRTVLFLRLCRFISTVGKIKGCFMTSSNMEAVEAS